MNSGRPASFNPVQRARWPRRVFFVIIAIITALALVVLSSFMFTRPSQALTVPRKFSSADIQLAAGYHIEPLMINLNAPSAAVFDGPDLVVAESGWAGGPPRILRVKPDGSATVLVSRGLRAPVTGLLTANGRLYISHRGKISSLDSSGHLRDLVTDLPSEGDNSNNSLALGADGKIYLGQGTVTNAGVVGLDSIASGWLDRNPNLHDVPCQDVTTLGQNYRTENPLKAEPNSVALTGAFQPFGSPGMPDEVVKGNPKCSGAILRFGADGSNLEWVAWGLHNPIGLAFDPSGQLWTTEQSVAARGSRVIANAPDELVHVDQGAWYGWPDYFDGQPVTADRFKIPGQPQLGMLWEKHPTLSRPYLSLGSVGADGLAFSPGDPFGYKGDAIVALLGPNSIDKAASGQAGFRVIHVDVNTRAVEDLAVNRTPGPASLNNQAGLERPASLVFGPDHSLYVIDLGIVRQNDQGLAVTPLTGAIWRIYAPSQRPLASNGPWVIRPQDPSTSPESEPVLIDVPFLYSLLVPWGVILAGLVVLVLIGVYILQWTRQEG